MNVSFKVKEEVKEVIYHLDLGKVNMVNSKEHTVKARTKEVMEESSVLDLSARFKFIVIVHIKVIS